MLNAIACQTPVANARAPSSNGAPVLESGSSVPPSRYATGVGHSLLKMVIPLEAAVNSVVCVPFGPLEDQSSREYEIVSNSTSFTAEIV
jgi:hypothetical protein